MDDFWMLAIVLALSCVALILMLAVPASIRAKKAQREYEKVCKDAADAQLRENAKKRFVDDSGARYYAENPVIREYREGIGASALRSHHVDKNSPLAFAQANADRQVSVLGSHRPRAIASQTDTSYRTQEEMSQNMLLSPTQASILPDTEPAPIQHHCASGHHDLSSSLSFSDSSSSSSSCDSSSSSSSCDSSSSSSSGF